MCCMDILLLIFFGSKRFLHEFEFFRDWHENLRKPLNLNMYIPKCCVFDFKLYKSAIEPLCSEENVGK
jgi:hypothetical protein